MSTTRPGTKGWAILEKLEAAYPKGVARQAVADEVDCTVQRVGEVVRQHKDLVVVGEEGGYAITPSAWNLYKRGEADAAKTVAKAESQLESVSKAEPSQSKVTDRLADALGTRRGEPESDASLYKRVMAAQAGETDDEFTAAELERAIAFAKAKKRKRPAS